MTTATEALAAIKSRLSTGIAFTLYYQGDPAPILPDTPTAFGFVVFDNFGSGSFGPVSFGGGAGQNRYRNEAVIEIYVFSPNRYGAAAVLAHAETVAARLRSYRDSYVSCFNADVKMIGPGSSISLPEIGGAVNNYQCAVAECSFHFDQIG